MRYGQHLTPEEGPTEEEAPMVGFCEGWRDVMNGDTYPISTLWDVLDKE
jgi:hypothetical protein